MRENRAAVKQHFEASCLEAWDQERTVRPVRPSAGTGGTRTKVARMSQAQGKGPTASQAAGGAQTHGDSGTYTKALMLVDSLLHDGSFSTAQAQKMRWMCMWRQPPITVLIKAYGTNPELFAIRSKELLDGMESSAAAGAAGDTGDAGDGDA